MNLLQKIPVVDVPQLEMPVDLQRNEAALGRKANVIHRLLVVECDTLGAALHIPNDRLTRLPLIVEDAPAAAEAFAVGRPCDVRHRAAVIVESLDDLLRAGVPNA